MGGDVRVTLRLPVDGGQKKRTNAVLVSPKPHHNDGFNSRTWRVGLISRKGVSRVRPLSTEIRPTFRLCSDNGSTLPWYGSRSGSSPGGGSVTNKEHAFVDRDVAHV